MRRWRMSGLAPRRRAADTTAAMGWVSHDDVTPAPASLSSSVPFHHPIRTVSHSFMHPPFHPNKRTHSAAGSRDRVAAGA